MTYECHACDKMIDHSFLILIIVSRDVKVIVLDYCSLIGLLFRHRSKQKKVISNGGNHNKPCNEIYQT